jgi:hypothetical protein
MSGPYFITGESTSPRLTAGSFRRDTAKDAVIKAVEVIGSGMWNVLITDPQRRVYGHEQFSLLIADDPNSN